MKKFLVLLLGVMLLAACSSQTTSTQQTTPQPTYAQQVAQAQTTTSAIDQIKADTIAKNDITQDIFIPVTYKKGKIGDTVAFGTMFNARNVLQPVTYFAQISFVKAIDSNSNKIDTNSTTVNSWLQLRQTDDMSFTENGNDFVPIVIVIGPQMAPGVKTAPGSYEFEIQYYKRLNQGIPDKVDLLRKSVFLSVQ